VVPCDYARSRGSRFKPLKRALIGGEFSFGLGALRLCFLQFRFSFLLLCGEFRRLKPDDLLACLDSRATIHPNRANKRRDLWINRNRLVWSELPGSRTVSDSCCEVTLVASSVWTPLDAG